MRRKPEADPRDPQELRRHRRRALLFVFFFTIFGLIAIGVLIAYLSLAIT